MTRVHASSRFVTTLTNLLRARFPYIYITTWEEDRAQKLIYSAAKNESLIKTPRAVMVWSVTTGLVGEGQPSKEETKSPLKLLEAIERFADPAIFLLKDFHIYFGGQGRQPDFQLIRKIRDLVPTLKQSPRPKNVIFLSPTLILPLELQKDVTVIDLDLPGYQEISHLLDEMIATNQLSGRIEINLLPEEKERLAKSALGLTLQEAENAFARAMVDDGKLDIRDVDLILEEKRQIIKKTGVLEFVKSDYTMEDIGGLENIKRWLKKRSKSWLDSAQRYSLLPPKGVLITGVPGCGKSLVAKAISDMWQLPLLRLDVGKIFGSLLGSSEENLRQAIQTAETIAPSILWIDEIEKGFTATGAVSDGGTSSRVFSTFLTWMQEKTSPVFVVATANNIHLLPPEFLRKGRFDEIFFVDLPTRKERVDIFRLHLARRLKDPQLASELRMTEEHLAHLADLTEGYIGAEIEQIVVSALFDAFSEDRPLRLQDLERAIRHTVPLSVTQAEEIRAIREWANVRAVSATLREDRIEYQAQTTPSHNGSSPGTGEFDVRSARGGRTVDF
ncbi:MAG: ATPase [Candidatus Dadabacteria bacterium]